MKISRIRSKNFKCFENRAFSFGERFNLIIGDNATGKTTLPDGPSVGLDSLSLGMPGPASPRGIQSDEARLAFYPKAAHMPRVPEVEGVGNVP